jgi:hypothetical protein
LSHDGKHGSLVDVERQIFKEHEFSFA